VDIAIFVHCDDVFTEHHLPHAPKAMHYFESLIRILLPDAHENQIVEYAFGRQRHIHDFREIHFEYRQKNSNGGVADVEIFHWRFTDDGRRVNRVTSVRDRSQMENGVVFDCGVKPGMITKRPFRAHLGWLQITFQNEINVCRHLQVDRFAPHQVD
jgi:hypothetical protein